MPLIAKTSFNASIDGKSIRLDAGAAFNGTAREAERLLAAGLIEEQKTKRKEVRNEH